jgi:hypothetical protein
MEERNKGNIFLAGGEGVYILSTKIKYPTMKTRNSL